MVYRYKNYNTLVTDIKYSLYNNIIDRLCFMLYICASKAKKQKFLQKVRCIREGATSH